MTKWEREIIFRTTQTKGQMAIAPQEDTIKFRQVRTDKGEEWAEWNAIENLSLGGEVSETFEEVWRDDLQANWAAAIGREGGEKRR